MDGVIGPTGHERIESCPMTGIATLSLWDPFDFPIDDRNCRTKVFLSPSQTDHFIVSRPFCKGIVGAMIDIKPTTFAHEIL